MGSDWIKWIHTAFRLKIFWDHRSEIGIHARRTRLHLKLLKLENTIWNALRQSCPHFGETLTTEKQNKKILEIIVIFYE